MEKPPKPARSKTLFPLWIGCGILVLLVFASVFAGVWMFADEILSAFPPFLSEEPGVKAINEMSEDALNFVEEKKLIRGSEDLILFYDVWYDRTEVALLTTERVVYYYEGRVTEIPLKEIEDVKRNRQDDGFGDKIDQIMIKGRSGTYIKVEIPPYEGSETFLSLLKDEWKAKTEDN